ncbi:MAG: O-methyltransferase [Hyphomonas sp.]|uniref:O-methyltransferase n=1 Tax=Hyphomonas sp. TaxID=87 RepID=UPI001E095317|nr:O-methyltransferase [Hyphomonas sp.]MBA4227874.1 O-methyltransferase [Hyphomonas sp.]
MADNPIFEAVDQFIDGLFASEDQALIRLRQRAADASLPHIEVSAGQGKLLYLLAKLSGARRILEIGTLGGYSGIWLGRALPDDGELVTLEIDPAYAAFARTSFNEAGIGSQTLILPGRALESLASLTGPFDLVFLDANKDEYPEYLAEAARLLRPGGLLLADNVVRKGAVLDPPADDPMAQGAARFLAELSAHPQFESIVLQQVGIKGHDGLALAIRR